ERRGHGSLHADHVVVAELVERTGGDARLHRGRDVVEDFRGETARDAHYLDVVYGFQGRGHGIPSIRRRANYTVRRGPGPAVPAAAECARKCLKEGPFSRYNNELSGLVSSANRAVSGNSHPAKVKVPEC